tara:strand:+ start:655 stop:840 length:186 start_codon:yes stop_codon:yes gene_type:complete
MIFKQIVWTEDISNKEEHEFEEIEDEELWEDGLLDSAQVQHKIIRHVLQIGDWKLIRRIDG